MGPVAEVERNEDERGDWRTVFLWIAVSLLLACVVWVVM